MKKFQSAANDFFKGILNNGSYDEKFEKVLLHIRMRGLKNSKNPALFFVIFLSFVLRLFGVVALTSALFSSLKNFLIATVISFAALHFFYAYMSLLDLIVLFFSVLAILNAKQLSDVIFCILFDIADLLAFGSFSKIYADIILKLDVESFLSKSSGVKSPFVLHFYATRQLFSNVKEQFEEDKIFNDYMKVRGNEIAAKQLIESYLEEQLSKG